MTAVEARKAHREEIAAVIPGNKRDALRIMASAVTSHLSVTGLDAIVGHSLHSLTQAERGRLEWALEALTRRVSGTKATAPDESSAGE